MFFESDNINDVRTVVNLEDWEATKYSNMDLLVFVRMVKQITNTDLIVGEGDYKRYIDVFWQ